MESSFSWPRALGRALVVCGLAGGGMTALTSLAQASSNGTLYVNGSTGTDTGTCRLQSHSCATIGYALNQAPSGATIKVAAGSYPEPLKIIKPVTIIGDGASGTGATVIDPSTLVSDTDTDSGTPQEVIVDVAGTPGVKLQKLRIDGSSAQSQFNGCSADFVGVYYHDASGSLQRVTVTDIELPPADFGCQDGLGVYAASDSGDTSSVTMSKLTVSHYDKNGVTCDDAGTTCTLTGSHITGIGKTGLIAQNGFQGYDAASVSLSGDTVSHNSYSGGGAGNAATGLLIFDVGTVSASDNSLSANDVNGYFGDDGSGPAAGTWTVSGNTVTGATDNVTGGEAGYGDGIDLDSTSNRVTISDNTVTKSAEYGIALTGATGATVTGNMVTGNHSDGIYVGGPGSVSGASDSSGNTITSNTASNNKGDGIFADTDSSGNLFHANIANYNIRYDLEDATGTSNTWSGNTCRPAGDSSPAGLC
jgi:parallel beta-helix repeat protein